MNKFLVQSASTAALSCLLLIGGCSSSSSGGGATVPANAVTITEANAESVVASLESSANTVESASAVEIIPSMSLMDALALVKPKIEAALESTGADLVYGVTTSETTNCSVSGTVTFSIDESGIYPNFTTSATLVASNCDDGLGFIVNASLSVLDVSNEETGDYRNTNQGSISVESTGPSYFKISFNDTDTITNGNDLVFGSETYTDSKVTFAVDFNTGGGFLVSLTAPIVESVGGEFSCPESGSILLTGADGTTAEAIYNGNDTMTIKANGVVVSSTTACINLS